MEALQSEKSRITQDHNEGSSLLIQDLQTLQERLHEADATLKRKQESYKQMQSKFTARLNKMEAEHQNLAKAVTLAESTLRSRRLMSSSSKSSYTGRAWSLLSRN